MHGSKAGLLMGPALLLPFAAVGTGLWWAGSAWQALGLYEAGMVTLLIQGRVPPRALLRGTLSGGARLAAGATVLAGPALYILWPWLDPRGALPDRIAAAGLAGASLAVFLPWFATVNAALEELYWRGWFPADRRWAADAAFGLYHMAVLCRFVHWPGALTIALVLVGCGAWWRRLGSRDELLPGLLAHAVGGTSVAVAVILRVGQGVP